MKRTWRIGLAAVVVLLVAGVGVYFLQGSHAPPGQPSLGEIDNQGLVALQAEFNRTSDKVRVILLLSPT
jgi:hypothetical protein